MKFKETVKQLAERSRMVRENIETEEATKTALVMPMLQALGYDVFNLSEVVPEFTCDVGIKKGEKIDYAILKNGQPVILIECKQAGTNLDTHVGQLFRYFATSTKTKFGLLTDGIEYRFFSDIAEKNVLDQEPFFVFNLDQFTEEQIEDLNRFRKEEFDVSVIYAWANQQSCSNKIKGILVREFDAPSEPLVRCLLKMTNPPWVSAKMVEQFTPVIKRSICQIINDTIVTRLIHSDDETTKEDDDKPLAQTESSTEEQADEEPRIVTTQEELEGFFLVRSILRPYVTPTRIHHRDCLSYFSVLLDDSNRKPICRLWLNRAKKYVSLFDAERKETRFEIKSIDDLYKYEKTMVKTVQAYDNVKQDTAKAS